MKRPGPHSQAGLWKRRLLRSTVCRSAVPVAMGRADGVPLCCGEGEWEPDGPFRVTQMVSAAPRTGWVGKRELTSDFSLTLLSGNSKPCLI